MSPSQLFEQVAKASPSFEAVASEHLADNGEVLPHVLMGDLVRYLGEYFNPKGMAAPANSLEVRSILALLDTALQSENSETSNVITVSFVEHLETEPFFASLRPLLGLALRREFKVQAAWHSGRRS